MCHLCYQRWQEEHRPSRKRTYALRFLYGITEADYDRMLSDQDGVCAICGRPERRKGKRLAVDHDAETGRIRGILCASCNVAIGLLGHDPETIRRAADYCITPEPSDHI